MWGLFSGCAGCALYTAGVRRPDLRQDEVESAARRGRRVARLLGLGLALACAAISPRVARAQGETDPSCPGTPARGPVEVTPSVGASGVTLDAPVMVRFSAGYFGPDGPGEAAADAVRVWRCEDSPVCLPCAAEDAVQVEARIAVYGDLLAFVPEVDLDPNACYSGLATGVDGDLEVKFATGARRDMGPPILGAVTAITPIGVGPSCEMEEGGYRVTFFVEPPLDDGPAGSLEYLLYLTRGPGVRAPVLRDSIRNQGSDSLLLLRLAPDEGHEPVCARIAVRDGVGNLTIGEEEHCIDPITAASFEGCAVSAAPCRAWPVVAALLALVLAGRRRRAGRAR